MNIPSQNKEEQVLYVAERLLPVHTGSWMVLNDNELVGPLKGHSTLEYGKGIKAINDERLNHKKAAADAAVAAIETTKKKMEIFVEEELELNFERTSALSKFHLHYSLSFEDINSFLSKI